MSKHNYPGLDYSGPGSTTNRDAETGIRYGVISQNSIQSDAMSDIWDGSRDLSYEAAKEELLKSIMSALKDEPKDHPCRQAAVEQSLRDLYYGNHREQERDEMAIEIIEAFDDYNGGTATVEDVVWDIVSDRFGDTYQDNGDRSWLWEKDGYELSNCLISDVFVSKSPYFTYASFCSPCCPGAGNLDDPYPWFEGAEPALKAAGILYRRGAEKDGWPKVFCLGHDFFENEEAPYPVFSVATGKRVLKEEQ